MPNRVRRALGRLVLRGPVLSAWTIRQHRKLEHAYCREILQSQPSERPHPKPSPRLKQTVQSILLVADCMWEQHELVPDLQRNWTVRVLDLSPHLRRTTAPEDETAFRAVKDFIRENASFTPDVILLYARAPLLSDSLFDALRRSWKCPLVGMNLDDKTTFFDYGIFSSGND